MARKRKNNRAATNASNKSKTAAGHESASDNKLSRATTRIILLGVAGVVAVALLVYLAFSNRQQTSQLTAPETAPITAAAYLGAAACKSCHEAAYEAWKGSHHALAMQQANDKTVLGNFANAKLSYGGITSTFFKLDGTFFVNTDGPDGKLRDFEIKYTFGVTPLQQYLIEFPDGRLQALSIAWDARPKQQGGQRWFHLYPKEKITHDDELHWTRPAQNWNFMCADCHSTELRKNYDAATNHFKTEWAEINVGCEACHGPGANHLEWAKAKQASKSSDDKSIGLTARLDERRGVTWNPLAASGNAARSRPRSSER
jgi:hypothetical protein